MTNADVLVVGAGVSGLTTAICLAEAGLRVRVCAAEKPEDTTSAAAGAMWGPYLVEPADRVRAWSDDTLLTLRRLSVDASTGVRLIHGVEASRTLVAPPGWGERLDDFRVCGPDELPPGFAAGWRFTTPMIDMPNYLEYLQRRLSDAGVVIETRRLSSLTEVDGVPRVVNCTGLGARELVPDPDLDPIRGQLLVVDNPGIAEFFSEDTGPSSDLLHIYPQGATVVLGGTAEPAVWSREPDPSTAAAILARCRAVEPRLTGARILDHRVGLRPTRPTVRLSTEKLHGTVLIHNYGHGGSGVTLSWGCAREVTAIASAC